MKMTIVHCFTEQGAKKGSGLLYRAVYALLHLTIYFNALKLYSNQPNYHLFNIPPLQEHKEGLDAEVRDMVSNVTTSKRPPTKRMSRVLQYKVITQEASLVTFG